MNQQKPTSQIAQVLTEILKLSLQFKRILKQNGIFHQSLPNEQFKSQSNWNGDAHAKPLDQQVFISMEILKVMNSLLSKAMQISQNTKNYTLLEESLQKAQKRIRLNLRSENQIRVYCQQLQTQIYLMNRQINFSTQNYLNKIRDCQENIKMMEQTIKSKGKQIQQLRNKINLLEIERSKNVKNVSSNQQLKSLVLTNDSNQQNETKDSTFTRISIQDKIEAIGNNFSSIKIIRYPDYQTSIDKRDVFSPERGRQLSKDTRFTTANPVQVKKENLVRHQIKLLTKRN